VGLALSGPKVCKLTPHHAHVVGLFFFLVFFLVFHTFIHVAKEKYYLGVLVDSVFLVL